MESRRFRAFKVPEVALAEVVIIDHHATSEELESLPKISLFPAQRLGDIHLDRSRGWNDNGGERGHRGDENHAKKVEAAQDVPERRYRDREAEIG